MEQRTGLTFKEVEASRRMHGENRFSEQKRRGFWRDFLSGFGDPMILILLASLFLNLCFTHGDSGFFESVGIALAILISVFVSTLSEYSSSRAFEKLREEAGKLVCRVRRDGKVFSVSATEVVVGDVVLLSDGDVIPADGRVLFGACSVNQSTLNGESREAQKYVCEKASALSDAGALFSGTTVSSGEAELFVETVGDRTLYGRLAASLGQTARKSPLKEKLSRLAKTIAKIGYCAAILVAGADLLYAIFELGAGDLLQGFTLVAANPRALLSPALHALTLAVTVVVVAVPEGLPMMITVVLSTQMRKMMREGVLVRKLAGIETAGTMDLLFCDKTGTLTEGTHRVRECLAFDGVRLAKTDPDADTLFSHFCLNNQARRTRKGARGSNATDRALLDAVRHIPAAQPSVVERLPFDSKRKYSAVLLSNGTVLYKGAPEKLLASATHVRVRGQSLPISAAVRQSITVALARRAQESARLIAFAQGQGPLSNTLPHTLELIFFAALSDDLRPETASTVSRLQQAGVQIVMLTGDSRESAVSIARRAGIFTDQKRVLSSEELAHLSDGAIRDLLPDLSVIYRCTPEDKSRLAKLSANEGRVVGMTGDGVNDAPALKLADVGFSMGSGTQIAKDASDIVLTDDRLSSLSNAVLYGRTVFRSIRKFLTFQLTMNFCAVLVSFIGPMLGIEAPITVMQMLWVNLIMDTLASLAFAGEPPREEYLRKVPLRRTEPILSRAVKGQILFGTFYSLLLSVFFLSSRTLRTLYAFDSGDTAFLTAFFLLFVFLGVFNMFNVRTPRQKLWAQLFQNRPFLLVVLTITLVQISFALIGSSLFRCCRLEGALITTPVLLALSILPMDLLRKGIRGKGKE
ncbi:MAG: calcium-translocating P-type ATPase, PMCA-type [Clostridia bacterium]|nr:calcium-translocating P-type ATPase, PMCA-type [Clostridia bacterium]